MRYIFASVVVALTFSSASFAQKTNEAIQKQLKTLKADKQITLSFDGGSSKIMAISDNFADSEAKTAGLQAMNFGMACFYPGKALAVSQDECNFAFWAMAKKPRFAGGSKWVVPFPAGDLDLGDSRYGPKPGENMEYLNFKLKREALKKIAAAPSPVKFKLGNYQFTFTGNQLALLKNLLAVTEVN